MDKEIAISGMSGRFPESDNVEELQNNLMQGIDMVTEDNRRWTPGIYGLPKRNGKLKNLTKFDANFFGIHAKQAQVMDPGLMKLLEITYEAIVDSGTNPGDLSGNNVGVFIGISFSESLDFFGQDSNPSGYAILGCARNMISNRISFVFNFKGPSMSIDTACSSSLSALHLAVNAIEKGECNSAIVGGCNLILNPQTARMFHKLAMLSDDGKCKSFDDSCNGYVRSEACVAIFLQKKSSAKRIYATIVGVGSSTDGYKKEGITYPSGNDQKKLLQEVLRKANINPLDVSYIEAHGTGTSVGDPEEINALAHVYCNGRTTGPLLIGSIKSNIGHSEPSSGLCSLIKVLIAMESGIIPGNLHYQTPNKNIPSLIDGRIKVVDKNTKWNGEYAAVNNFGFGGTNAHLILKSNHKSKSILNDKNVPMLVAVTGRTEKAVEYFLNKIENLAPDNELISLIHDIHKKNISGHLYGGYTVLGSKNKFREISLLNRNRKVWYILNGMGSQWVGMGRELMKIKPFSKSILNCGNILKRYNINLIDLIFKADEEIIGSVLNACVLLASIQIALIDTLSSVGVVPDGIIGHSAGEITCAYADGCLTAEETILLAYWRGKCAIDCNLPPGSMAAIGLSREETNVRKPKSCFVACNNANDSITLSGPVNDVENFVKDLNNKGIFAKLVNSCGIAFHSKYVSDVEPKLKEKLDQVIPVGKIRSKNWISTTIPESEWNTKIGRECSSEYFVRNFTSPVLFYEAIQKIPEDSIVIELGPHCLLLALIKRVVPKSCITIGLLNKGIPDEVSYFLGNLGKLFNNGLNLNFEILHEAVSYPVSRGTPMISSMIIMDHSVDWKPDGYFKNASNFAESIVTVDLTNNKYKYLSGHLIDDRILFPATGYLVIVWETFAELNKTPKNNFPVLFQDVHFVRATIMPKSGAVNFLVNILIGSGKFELCENGSIVAYGYIKSSEGLDIDRSQLDDPEDQLINMELNQNEFYKEFKLRGYQHYDYFKAVIKSDIDGEAAVIEWKDNWVSFIDGLLQFRIMYGNSRNLCLPSTIKTIIIDPIQHASLVKNEQNFMLKYNKEIDVVKCGGVEMHALKTTTVMKKSIHSNMLLEHYSFIPYECKQEMTREDALTVITQIILENLNETNLKIAEILNEDNRKVSVIPIISNVFKTERYVRVDITTKEDTDDFIDTSMKSEQQLEYFHVIITNRITNRREKLNNILIGLHKYGYLLTEENYDFDVTVFKDVEMTLISKIPTKDKCFLLLLKKSDTWIIPKLIMITQDNYNWIDEAKVGISNAVETNQKYMMVSEGKHCGLLGLFKCVRRENGGDNFRCVVIDQLTALPFSLAAYKDHLSKDLAVNILKDGVWGTYRHLKLKNDIKSENSERMYITTVNYGELSSLKWVEAPLTYYKPKVDGELCTVCFASLNFLDIVAATGQLPLDYIPQYKNLNIYPGIEFAGYDSKGNRIMGITPHSSLATHTMVELDYKIPVPKEWSMEQAATVPVAYATCYYGLIVRGQMKRGESILIHSGAGGVGLAAITLALSMDCEVFTTVGSQHKRLFLKQQFPNLEDNHIGNSRDTSFEKMIMKETKARGVDLVLNSLTGDKFQASFRCLAYNGRFIEIGKADLVRNAELGMVEFLKNISVHAIFLNYFHEDFLKKTGDGRRTMQLLKEGIASGVVKPLPSSVFESDQLEQSFRHMTTGKHIGKVLVKVRDEKNNNICKISSAVSEIYFDAHKSYIIIGGLGGFGLELANWMITRGAEILILSSNSGIRNGYQKLRLKYWKENGVTVIVSKENCLTLYSTQNLIKLANKLAPVGGIFHLALILRDGNLVEQTKENFEDVCNCKYMTTLYLDRTSREFCKLLEYFVVFSSQLCGRGNAESSTYAMANSAMERICDERNSDGFPALAIQWGPIDDVGVVADKILRGKNREIYGRIPQKIESCMSVLDVLLSQNYSTVCSGVLPEIKHLKSHQEKTLIEEIGKILGIQDINGVNHETPLSEFGIDSLMGSEIRQILEREFGIILNATKIRTLSFKDLADMENQIYSFKNNENNENLPDNGGLLFHTLTELVPKETVIQMKQFISNNTNLFMIHSIEGFTFFLNEIASYLKCNVWGLQCTENAPISTIEQLAAHYLKEVYRIQPKGPYYILGYSYGATIALEMVKQLEEQNEQCELIMVDSSPEYTKGWINSYIDKYTTDSEKHAVLLAYFCASLKGNTSIYRQILKEIINEKDIKSQLIKCSEKFQFNNDLSKNEFITAASSFYKKVITALNYNPNFKLKSNITFIKAEHNFIKAEDDDYGLQKYSDKRISIHKMNGSHTDIIRGDTGKQMAEIVSSLLNKQ